MEKLILNSENKLRLREIIDYVEQYIHFDVFLDILSLNISNERKLEQYSRKIVSRYTCALFVGERNLDFLDKFLCFREMRIPVKNRVFNHDIAENWLRLNDFYNEQVNRHGK